MLVDTHRWNVERDGSDLLICEGDHEKHEGCAHVRYIRADLCVLASTHQRVIEALREAEKALAPFAEAGGTTMFGNEEDVPLHFKGKHFRRARAALAAIKEHTP